MKLYNQTLDKIENYNTITGINGETLYANRLTDTQLNEHGYYKLKYDSMPNTRYYISTKTGAIVDGKYVISYAATERPLSEVKSEMLKDLTEAFVRYSERPRVPTPSGIVVDGGRNDLKNFEIGKDLNVPIIKDADNVDHAATVELYDEIILAIKQHGLSLWMTKNTKENEIKSFTTLLECIDYENFAYDYTVTQADVDADSTLTVGDIVLRHKNNVNEW